MKNIKKAAKTLTVTSMATLGLVGLAVMNSAVAVEDDPYWYLGGNIGQSRARIDDAQIKAVLQTSGLTTTSMSDDDRDIAFRLFGGYRFNQNLALEGGYFSLGKFTYLATTVPAGTQNGSIRIQGLNLDAVGTLPIKSKLSAFARFGLQYAQAKDTFASTGGVPIPADINPSKSALNFKAGLGLQYDFNRSLGIRAETERYRINDGVGSRGDINVFSLGLVYRFDERKTAPAPAPVIVYVPVKTKTEMYCSILDLNFEINADEMQRDDKEKLATLGTYLNKYPGAIAVIEGHTDNVGSPEKNMELSVRRAESVVKYLVDELHVAPSRLVSKGYGETRPIADNSTREGQQMNRRIGAVIGCAPDIEGLKVAATRVTMALEMEFDPMGVDIDPMYRDQLIKVANYMKANPSVSATVEGHAGKYIGTGSDRAKVSPELAMEISQKRAQNVVDYLANNLGIARSRLSAEGFGQTRLVAYSTTLEGQEENRRVNIIFKYKAR